MRRPVLLAAITIALSAGAAAAQVATGPLADPGVAATHLKPVSGAKTVRKVGHGANRKHARKASAPAAQQPAAAAAAESRPAPTSSADHRVNADATDPISFGMKWNGSNDNAEKTRVQNYDGDAQGTGAEVGLKLHF